MEMQKHKFPYNWRISEAKFTKDKGKVFSCFACVVALQWGTS